MSNPGTKSKLTIIEMSTLPNGKILVGGSVVGSPLTAGKRGYAITSSGELKVEVVSVGIVDSTRAKPNMQALQIKVLHGNKDALKGATLEFE